MTKKLNKDIEEIKENIDVDIDVGDTVLGGRFKNKQITVKKIGKDDLNQPTINDKPLLKYRIKKDMPEKKKNLKEIHEEELNEQEFGNVLFGRERELPKGNPEPNTEEEDQLSIDLANHYDGFTISLIPWISRLVQAKNKGLYKDILDVPSKYNYAYRIMSDVPLKALTSMLGYEPTNYESEEIYEETKGGTFIPSLNQNEKKDHYSWTVNVGVFKKILNDWGNITGRPKPGQDSFIVFMRAPIKQNLFLMNPDETEYWARDYSYQEEIISVGNVQCDHIWFVPYTTKIKNATSDYTLYHHLANLDAKAIKHVEDYENSRRLDESSSSSSSKEKATAFLRKVKNKNPELYAKLVDKAEWWLRKQNNEYTPKDLKTAFRAELNQDPEMDPIKNLDSVGIKLAIDAVSDDKEDASASKRLFSNTFDQVLKE